MTDLSADLSAITNIPKSTLDKLTDKSCYCIGHVVEESILDHEDMSEIDIGIGTLLIKVSDSSILYKFIPSKKLENIIKNTVDGSSSPLVSEIEDSLVRSITNTYKEYF